ncbi:MAG TPA: TetR/AcrR family transcriptional regulator [Blastocatellia bacterium]|nr:TetR/AcrR family transcriptional regulator [Blastocatellia bacterium]
MGESAVLGLPADPKQARSKQTKEKIVQAAIKLFEERGYEKTTSNDIAAEAGVSVGSFYVYFTDKRQLLLTIFDRVADELYNSVFMKMQAEQLFDSDIGLHIRDAVSSSIIDKEKRAGLHRVFGEMMHRDAEFGLRVKKAMERSQDKLRELISLAKKAGLTWDIDVAAAAFLVQRVVFDLSQDYVSGFVQFDEARAIDALAQMIERYIFKPRVPGE